MKHLYTKQIQDDLALSMGRPLKDNELENCKNDALLLARLSIKKIELLEERILLLEKK